MYEDQKKEERKKAREEELAADPPMYLCSNIATQASRYTTAYGKSMGNGGVGTLEYLGINWDREDKEDDMLE